MIETGLSAQSRRPQTTHRFTYSYANASLVSLPLRLALVGVMGATGTATAGQVYEISDAAQGDALFRSSSELSLMIRKALETGSLLQRGPRLYAVGLAEPGAGTADVRTLTVTGTATADGNHIIEIAGRQFAIGVRTGAAQNTVAAAIAAALQARQAELPVLVTVATNVVTLTSPHKGENGGDVTMSVVQAVSGSALAFASSAAGAGVADITTALDALGPMPFDAVAIGNHKAADITDINADIAIRWALAEKRWRYYFLGEPGSIATATALAAAANHTAVVVASMEGCKNTAGEMATAVAFGVFSRERPNANYDGLQLPLFPPAAATVYTPTEVEAAIDAGLTPLTANVDPFTGAVTAGRAKVERLITTKTTENSAPFEVLRDIGVSRTGIFIAQQLDAAYQVRFSGDANPDGTLATDATGDQIEDLATSIVRLAEGAQILRNVDADLAKLLVERDGVALGRFNVDLAYTVVVGLHQIAYLHRVQV